jgi:hypothetical protein
VDTHYNWVKFYEAAVLETNPKLLPERIEDAKNSIGDKFRGGDRVHVRNSLRAMIGTVNSREPEGTRRRYVVEFDPRENEAKFLERGVFYEDELELRDRAFRNVR